MAYGKSRHGVKLQVKKNRSSMATKAVKHKASTQCSLLMKCKNLVLQSIAYLMLFIIRVTIINCYTTAFLCRFLASNGKKKYGRTSARLLKVE